MPVVEIRNYNTNLIVQYWKTETELLKKIEARTGNDLNVHENPVEPETVSSPILDDCDAVLESNEHNHYTKEDVEIICHKLYQDELCGAFNCDTFLDESINTTMSLVFNELNTDSQFVSVLNRIRDEYFSKKNMIHDATDIDNFNNYLFYLLFSYDLFYIIHQIICQQLTTGEIDSNLCLQLYLALHNIFSRQI